MGAILTGIRGQIHGRDRLFAGMIHRVGQSPRRPDATRQPVRQLGNREAPKGAIAATPELTRAPDTEPVSFSFCHVGRRENCVVDWATIWLHGQKIRVADIDAPETHEYRCAVEKTLGDRATFRLRELLDNGAISLGSIDRDEDQYCRKLRIFLVVGVSVGEALVDEGLARWYEGGRRPWC